VDAGTNSKVLNLQSRDRWCDSRLDTTAQLHLGK